MYIVFPTLSTLPHARVDGKRVFDTNVPPGMLSSALAWIGAKNLAPASRLGAKSHVAGVVVGFFGAAEHLLLIADRLVVYVKQGWLQLNRRQAGGHPHWACGRQLPGHQRGTLRGMALQVQHQLRQLLPRGLPLRADP